MLAQDLAARFGLPYQRALGDVRELLAALREAGLLTLE
ncbi:MAG TPA: PqqD family peptide modification chaperone [Thermomicrobiales bacterium]|nr:PqqD family peptide modification chaperone [Thermomicrobiales bacterium]